LWARAAGAEAHLASVRGRAATRKRARGRSADQDRAQDLVPRARRRAGRARCGMRTAGRAGDRTTQTAAPRAHQDGRHARRRPSCGGAGLCAHLFRAREAHEDERALGQPVRRARLACVAGPLRADRKSRLRREQRTVRRLSAKPAGSENELYFPNRSLLAPIMNYTFSQSVITRSRFLDGGRSARAPRRPATRRSRGVGAGSR
jgi:hypothetical protein